MQQPTNWHVTYPRDPRVIRLADKHYSRQKPGSPEASPPGRKLVLINADETAVWITSYPFAEYVHRVYPDAWVCTLFRHERHALSPKSSQLIREAVAATRWKYGTPPAVGMITMIDPKKVQSDVLGYCYRRAKFHHVGETKGGLLIFQLLPARMPAPAPAYGMTHFVFEEKEVMSHAAAL